MVHQPSRMALPDPPVQRTARHHEKIRVPVQCRQSLQQYLAGELRRLAERPGIGEVLDRIDRHRGGRVGLRQAAEDLAQDLAGD